MMSSAASSFVSVIGLPFMLEEPCAPSAFSRPDGVLVISTAVSVHMTEGLALATRKDPVTCAFSISSEDALASAAITPQCASPGTLILASMSVNHWAPSCGTRPPV